MSAAASHVKSSFQPTSPKPAAGRGWRVRCVGSVAELTSEVPLWQTLANAASEPNAFYEPWFLLPAAEHFETHGESWKILIVERDGAHGPEWGGFFPFLERSWKGLPGTRRLQLWQHDQCFLTTPLVRLGVEEDVLRTLLGFLRSDSAFPGLLHWPLAGADGRIQQALIEITRSELLGVYVHDQFNRALLKRQLNTPKTGEQPSGALTGHHLRELRRQRRRLEDSGPLEVRLLQSRAQLGLWTDWFLKLEASGWKGREGTALESTDESRQFLEEMLAAGFESGAIEFWGLFQQGEPLAMKLNFRSGVGSFSFKIAYDERFHRCSPGVQLELEHLQRFPDSGLEWMDSCAVSGHAMIGRLWPERRRIQNLLLSTGRWQTDLWIAGLPLARALLRTVRRCRRWCSRSTR